MASRVGPDHHCMTYSVRGGRVLNLVFIAPLGSEERTTDVEAIHSELVTHFGHWDKT